MADPIANQPDRGWNIEWHTFFGPSTYPRCQIVDQNGLFVDHGSLPRLSIPFRTSQCVPETGTTNL